MTSYILLEGGGKLLQEDGSSALVLEDHTAGGASVSGSALAGGASVVRVGGQKATMGGLRSVLAAGQRSAGTKAATGGARPSIGASTPARGLRATAGAVRALFAATARAARQYVGRPQGCNTLTVRQAQNTLTVEDC